MTKHSERLVQGCWSTDGFKQLTLPIEAGEDFTEEFSFEFSLDGLDIVFLAKKMEMQHFRQ